MRMNVAHVEWSAAINRFIWSTRRKFRNWEKLYLTLTLVWIRGHYHWIKMENWHTFDSKHTHTKRGKRSTNGQCYIFSGMRKKRLLDFALFPPTFLIFLFRFVSLNGCGFISSAHVPLTRIPKGWCIDILVIMCCPHKRVSKDTSRKQTIHSDLSLVIIFSLIPSITMKIANQTPVKSWSMLKNIAESMRNSECTLFHFPICINKRINRTLML